MKAIVAKEFGGPEVLQLEELPDPEPGAGQVRVKVHAVGVNPFDTYMRTGAYAIKPPLPYSPGADAAGIVDRIGNGVTNVSVGDRVYVAGTAQHRAYGAYASMVLCEALQVHPLPSRTSFVQGAAVNVPYVTAWCAPCFLTRSNPSGEPAVPITVSPAARASWVAATPTPPLAP